MKTEAQITEAIRAMGLLLQRHLQEPDWNDVNQELRSQIDTLCWVMDAEPIIEYPPIDHTVMKQRQFDARDN